MRNFRISCSSPFTLTACAALLVGMAPLASAEPAVVREKLKASDSALRNSEPKPAIVPPVDPISGEPPSVEQVVEAHLDAAPYENYFSISYENDLIGDGEDKFYTSGVRFTYFNINSKVPRGIDLLAGASPSFEQSETTATFFSIGQNLYTPSEIDVAEDQPNDRPWAAWLYGSVGLSTATDDHVDDFELTLGVVGPEAQGEDVQKWVHSNLSKSEEPKGWDNQIKFEPGVIIAWQRRWPRGIDGTWYVDVGDSFRLSAEPNINIALGNIYTYGGAGMMFVLAPYRNEIQDSPPRVRPAMSGTGFFNVPNDNWSWYLFAGLDGRAVARNIFLDGNTFKDSASVDKRILVGDAVAGIAVTIDDYRIAYTMNYRTEEFESQDDDTVFGSLTFTPGSKPLPI